MSLRHLLLVLALTAFSAALTAAPASAARSYLCQITGAGEASTSATECDKSKPGAPGAPFEGFFKGYTDLAVDNADNLWVVDSADSLVEKFDPSGNFLSQATGAGAWEGSQFLEAAAWDTAADKFFVGDAGPDTIWGLEPDASYLGTELNPGLGGCCYFSLAADNSAAPSGGDIYVYATGKNTVTRIKANGEAAPFSATASYIDTDHPNRLTGSPSGAFSAPEAVGGGIAVDSSGKLYVVNGHVVDEFAPSGAYIQSFAGTGAPGGFSGELGAVAVDPTNADVLVSVIFDEGGSPNVIDEFSQAGEFLGQLAGPSPSTPFGFGHAFFVRKTAGIVVDSGGHLYVADEGPVAIDKFGPGRGPLALIDYAEPSGITHDTATVNAEADPNGGGDITDCHFEYGTDTSFGLGSVPCLDNADGVVGTSASHITSSIDVHADLSGLAGDTTYRYRLILTDANGTQTGYSPTVEALPSVLDLQTTPAIDITNASATLRGSFTAEAGVETKYFFEYGTSSNYGHKSNETVVPSTATGSQEVGAQIEGLVANTTYYFRILAENKYGHTSAPSEESFTTFQPPTIEAFSSSALTATTAILHAHINPQGFETTCRFEYGTTVSYGQSQSCPGPLSGTTAQAAEVRLENLQPGTAYHFRLLAQSKWGTVTSEDQSFEFFPSSCPNAAVRQQTGSPYIPDCRAYELVSPENAEGTLLFAGGPNTGHATSPSRFSFSGSFGSLPATNTVNTVGDLYVATRTDTGWVSRYIGLPGSQVGCMGGPPTSPGDHESLENPPWLTNTVLADPSLEHILNFTAGVPLRCAAASNGNEDADLAVAIASNAPYLWSADGALLRRLPTDLQAQPGALEALDCPYGLDSGAAPQCTGETTASPYLGHLVFSSRSLALAPGGLTAAPGSAYDEDLATGTLSLISTLKSTGQPIPQDPAFASTPRVHEDGDVSGGAEEFIRFPAVSTDGSRILMSTATAGTGGGTCKGGLKRGRCRRFIDTPVHLYMSIDDEPALEVSRSELTNKDVPVSYVGMTADGSKVYFTSEEHLTAADPGHQGASLYMWSQHGEAEGHPLTLVSKAAPGSGASAGDTGACSPALVKVAEGQQLVEVPWTTKCSVLAYSSYPYSVLPGGIGGNGISDTGIASASGDIFFYSPEQLDGDHGVLGQQNLYDYREGAVHFVATLTPEHHCRPIGFALDAANPEEQVCSAGPLVRIAVSPDGSHAALVTASRLTSYENAGHLEMYSYTPAAGSIVCDSCRPDGRPATADIQASEDGLFMTDDGRAFFSTTEPLSPADTNRGVDVYEFVEGRPRLITPGTGTATVTENAGLGSEGEIPGLVGVSAEGTDVYFSTFDPLVSEDHNGNFFRFYDARTNGGFAQPPPVQPCAAAEECHGPGTEAPEHPIQGTTATLASGNVTPRSRTRTRHHKKHKRAKHRHHHRRSDVHGRGGAK